MTNAQAALMAAASLNAGVKHEPGYRIADTLDDAAKMLKWLNDQPFTISQAALGHPGIPPRVPLTWCSKVVGDWIEWVDERGHYQRGKIAFITPDELWRVNFEPREGVAHTEPGFSRLVEPSECFDVATEVPS